ncbi:MAG: acyl-CoA/acyl-ACP dehydrogenase [Actinomycetota bacterium]|nr:acyl-CoA/acyl-ACP dehydrogenase [Actinomycetota bacterium]
MTDLLYGEVEEQLRASARDLLAERADWRSVLARTESGEPYDRSLWRALAVDLGVAGLPVEESLGGHGASWRETAVIAEELGRCVAPTPFLGAVLATALAAAIGADDLVTQFASGETTGTLAMSLAPAPGSDPYGSAVFQDGILHGTVANVIDGLTAEVLLVVARDGDTATIVCVDTREVDTRDDAVVARTPVACLDLTRPLCDMTFDGAPGVALATGAAATEALAHARVVGAAILAAEQLGLAQRCLDMTVDYLKSRYQFGRAVGGFQALKHRLADVWASITQARALARYAAACVADRDPDAAVAASLAQAYCSPVAVRAAEECLQLHGGIGFTWEHPAHLYLKRAKADAIILGTAAQHRVRLGELVALPAA